MNGFFLMFYLWRRRGAQQSISHVIEIGLISPAPAIVNRSSTGDWEKWRKITFYGLSLCHTVGRRGTASSLLRPKSERGHPIEVWFIFSNERDLIYIKIGSHDGGLWGDYAQSEEVYLFEYGQIGSSHRPTTTTARLVSKKEMSF